MKTPRLRFTIRSLLFAVTLVAFAALGVSQYFSYLKLRPELTTLTLQNDRSMEPYIGSRVYFVADINAYRARAPQRWDAVVFDLKPQAIASALWVVGLPGETVSFSNGRILINGNELELSARFHGRTMDFALPDNSEVNHPYTDEKDCYYLLGENPIFANDSRSWGAVQKSRIAGRVHR